MSSKATVKVADPNTEKPDRNQQSHVISGVSTITRKGQVTIPAAIRQRLNLHEGDRVAFLSEGDRLSIRRTDDLIDELYGIFSAYAPKKENDAKSIAAEKEIIAAAWAEQTARSADKVGDSE